MASSSLDDAFTSLLDLQARPCIVSTGVTNGADAWPAARLNSIRTWAPLTTPCGSVPLLTYKSIVEAGPWTLPAPMAITPQGQVAVASGGGGLANIVPNAYQCARPTLEYNITGTQARLQVPEALSARPVRRVGLVYDIHN